MKLLAASMLFLSLLVGTGLTASATVDQSQNAAQPGRGRSGMGRWPMGPRLGRHANVSMPRHHLVMAQGVPAPYASMTNPLPGNRASVERGASIYAQRCVTCHGVYGHGDGEGGRNLTPPPGNLAWLSQIGLGRQVAYLYWTVAEGGVPLGSGMPAFKDALSAEEIWAVIAYIQDRLPQSSK